MRDRGRVVAADDWYRIRWVGDPDLSPDGRRVAFEVSYLDPGADRIAYEVHWSEVEGSRGGCLTSAGVADRAPRWAPDGRRLAVVSTRGDESATRVLDVETGAARTPARVRGVVRSVEWAPDGERLVAVVQQPDERPGDDRPYEIESMGYRVDGVGVRPRPAGVGIWVQPVRGEAATCLTQESWEEWAAAWSPRGDLIAFLSSHRQDREWSARTGLWIVRPDGSGRRRLVAEAGPIRALAWSPDGDEIAFLGHRQADSQGENVELWVVNRRGGAAQRISDIDRSLGLVVRGEDERGFGPPDLAWSADGRSILVAYADGGISGIEAFERAGGRRRVVAGPPACLAFAVARASDVVAYVASSPADPGELAVIHADGNDARPVSGLNQGWLRDLDLSVPRAIHHRSSDGFDVSGWLTLPPGQPKHGGPVPLLVQVHGGPHYPVGERFALDVQRIAARGYAVLTGNPRGSQGYGARFATAIRGDWGGGDYRDLMGLVDAAIATGYVDESRLAIMGESYGGYLTNWAIAHTERFRVAVTENSLSDLVAAYAGPSGPAFWRSELRGTPWNRPRVYLARSPIRYVDRIRTPLLILHAELDQNCPTSQSDELFGALRTLRRDVRYVRIPGEGHLVNLFGRPSRRAARRSIIDAWLDRHLAV
jgi:dipeptidyl aminopeptidase/acylaminoacyl peptidase